MAEHKSSREVLRLKPEEVRDMLRSGEMKIVTPVVTPEEQAPEGKELTIADGTRAYPLPEYEFRDRSAGSHEFKPPTLLQAENQLNIILDSIKSQGGRLIGVIPVTVTLPSEPSLNENRTAVKSFLIVEK